MNEASNQKGLSRRDLVAGAAAGSALFAVGCRSGSTAMAGAAPAVATRQGGPYELPALPWAMDALEPHISERTMGFHYGKHHKGYVDKLNDAVKGSDLGDMELDALVKRLAGDEKQQKLFNNAAQAWNHTFFWNSMRPGGGGAPQGELARRIEASFGSADGFAQAFKETAGGVFGTGWAWLVADGEKLAVVGTQDADTPLARGKRPLLTIDVWEHAYYLDYQNRRGDFIQAYLDHLVNWEFAAKNI